MNGTQPRPLRYRLSIVLAAALTTVGGCHRQQCHSEAGPVGAQAVTVGTAVASDRQAEEYARMIRQWSDLADEVTRQRDEAIALANRCMASKRKVAGK